MLIKSHIHHKRIICWTLSILHILLRLISTTTLWSNSNRTFIKSLFLIGRWLLYNVVLVSVVQQHASALSTHTHTHTHTHISPPSWASSSTPHLTALGRHRAPGWAPSVTQQLPTGSSTHGSVHIPMLLFNPSHPFFPPLCPQVHSLCLRLYSCPANRFINIIFLDAIYTH